VRLNTCNILEYLNRDVKLQECKVKEMKQIFWKTYGIITVMKKLTPWSRVLLEKLVVSQL
jgi:hypothetical protein